MQFKDIAIKAVYSVILVAIGIGMLYTVVKNRRVDVGKEMTAVDIENSFQSYVEKKEAVQQLVLVEQQINEIEVREYKFKVKGKPVSTAVLEIRAPVTYSYYLDFKDEWSFLVANGYLRVVAPPIKVKPPSIDTGKMKTNIMGGYMILNESAKMDEFKNEFFDLIKTRSSSPEYVRNITEDARLSLATFLTGWMSADLKNRNTGEIKGVLIKFKDEEKFPPLGFSFLATNP